MVRFPDKNDVMPREKDEPYKSFQGEVTLTEESIVHSNMSQSQHEAKEFHKLPKRSKEIADQISALVDRQAKKVKTLNKTRIPLQVQEIIKKAVTVPEVQFKED